jgi:flagellar motor switch protein FliG
MNAKITKPEQAWAMLGVLLSPEAVKLMQGFDSDQLRLVGRLVAWIADAKAKEQAP